MTNVLDQIDRLKQVYNKKTDVSLAEVLGISKITVSGWKKRKAIPAEIFKRVAQNENISMDWLLRGIGKMNIEVDYGQIQDTNYEYSARLSPENDEHLRIISEDENNEHLIMELLRYAPKPFIEQLITRLDEFKRLSDL